MLNLKNLISVDDLDSLYTYLAQNTGKKIAVWGAGGVGLKLVSLIKKFNIGSVDCFVDSDVKKHGVILADNIPVCGFERVEEDIDNYAIIIASFWHEDIRKTLDEQHADYFDAYNLIGLSMETTTFKKFYKDKEMKEYFCPIPFQKMYLYERSSTLCCPQYMGSMSIGIVSELSVDELWNSPLARQMRQSVIDGSYCFCDFDICTEKKLMKRDALNDKWKRHIEEESTIVENGPEILTIGIDRSCNLICKMCRSNKIDRFEEAGVKASYDKIINYCWKNCKTLVMNGSGEVFYGPNDIKLLENITSENFPALETIQIATNGVLFNEYNWNRISYLADQYRIEVMLSVDAYTEETYNKIRINGVFRALQDNLRMISELRQQDKIQYFELRFCVQNDNWREMEDFVHWAEELSADKLWFQVLRGMNAAENIHDPNHEHYKEFVEQVKKPIFHQKWIDIFQLERELNLA